MGFSLGSPTGGALTAAAAAEDDKFVVVDTSVGATDAANKTMTFAEARALILRPRGALVTLSTNIVSPTVPYIVAWDSETGGYDTDAIHDTVTDNSRLVVPSGWTKVRIGAQIAMSSVTAASVCSFNIRKNQTGTAFSPGIGLPTVAIDAGTTSTFYATANSAIVDVVAGDWFNVRVNSVDTTITLDANFCSFWMELIS